ncbi:hypothetical protein GCM10017044_19550 [Kordiimonas sediminis]|uniref:Uncharacterized protein n=1 Tax=Kordiimonas sediminis TaxID=1735581 RepID=A0A919E8M5_9PROT|nr:hypothetical protein [Kordiimonas sediminis]GHF24883.1 hypothetical protein GCM10017044_19550 [Kordiimonas sediminis]
MSYKDLSKSADKQDHSEKNQKPSAVEVKPTDTPKVAEPKKG